MRYIQTAWWNYKEGLRKISRKQVTDPPRTGVLPRHVNFPFQHVWLLPLLAPGSFSTPINVWDKPPLWSYSPTSWTLTRHARRIWAYVGFPASSRWDTRREPCQESQGPGSTGTYFQTWVQCCKQNQVWSSSTLGLGSQIRFSAGDNGIENLPHCAKRRFPIWLWLNETVPHIQASAIGLSVNCMCRLKWHSPRPLARNGTRYINEEDVWVLVLE